MGVSEFEGELFMYHTHTHSSLCFVDLRLCYPLGHVTRTCYEYDISFLNGYYKMHNQEPTTENVEDKQEVFNNFVWFEMQNQNTNKSILTLIVPFVHGEMYPTLKNT